MQVPRELRPASAATCAACCSQRASMRRSLPVSSSSSCARLVAASVAVAACNRHSSHDHGVLCRNDASFYRLQVDNPKVGPTLRDSYWRPGNSEQFLDLVRNLTTKPLTGDAWVDMLKQEVPALLAEEKVAYDAAVAQAKGSCDIAGKRQKAEIDLGMRIKIVDGDAVIADTEQDGGFLATCDKFEKYIRGRFAAPSV